MRPWRLLCSLHLARAATCRLLPRTIHRPPPTAHHPPPTTHHPPPTHAPLTHAPLPLATHHSPFATHHPPHCQANNFHFLVPPSAGVRSASLFEPDHPIAWELVRAVRHVTTHSIRCPICLSEQLTAPQVSGCGHILCLPCALRFHASAEACGGAFRCPLCLQHLELRELRSVCFLRARPVSVLPAKADPKANRKADPARPDPRALGLSTDLRKRDPASLVSFKRLRLGGPCESVADVGQANIARPRYWGHTEVGSHQNRLDSTA